MSDARRFSVLILCTGNSARSQMAEALLRHKGGSRFFVDSAGSRPAARVNPYALSTVREHGIPYTGHPPRGLDGLDRQHWDLVITVCDNARESCPLFPGQPAMAHWGMEDPAAVTGSDGDRRRAFNEAFLLLSRRIDLLVALPIEKLERLAAEARVREIGTTT